MKIYFFLTAFILLNIVKINAQVPIPNYDKSWIEQDSDLFNYSSYSDFLFSSQQTNGGFGWHTNVWGNDHDVLNHHEKVYWPSDNNDTTMFFHPDASGTKPDSSYMRFYLKKKHRTVGSVVYDYITTVMSLPSTQGWKYGYIEMSYRLPDWTATKSDVDGIPQKTSLAGFSNALWMFEQDIPHNVRNSEIDIFEDYNGFNQMEPNMHYLDSPPMPKAYHGSDSAAFRILPRVVFNNTWHTISVDWSPAYVNTYCDGVLSMHNTKYSDSLLKMGLILGESINAYYTNNGYADSTEYADTHTQFPYYMDINHIKIWQLNMDSCSGTATVVNKIDANTFPFGVKKSIRVTGNAATHITSGQHVTLRATDFIEIDKNFTVDKGASFEMLPAKCEP